MNRYGIAAKLFSSSRYVVHSMFDEGAILADSGKPLHTSWMYRAALEASATAAVSARSDDDVV